MLKHSTFSFLIVLMEMLLDGLEEYGLIFH